MRDDVDDTGVTLPGRWMMSMISTIHRVHINKVLVSERAIVIYTIAYRVIQGT